MGTWQHGFPPLSGRKLFAVSSAHRAGQAVLPGRDSGERRGSTAHCCMFRGWGVCVLYTVSQEMWVSDPPCLLHAVLFPSSVSLLQMYASGKLTKYVRIEVQRTIILHNICFV
jgi:hypothetical protein